MTPQQFITREEAENLMMKALQEYEQKIVQPRHEENMKAIRRIERNWWIAFGATSVVLFLVKLFWK